MSTPPGTEPPADPGHRGSDIDPRRDRPQRLFYSNDIGIQFIEELRAGTTAMRAEFASQIEQLTTLLAQTMALGAQRQAPPNQPPPDQTPPGQQPPGQAPGELPAQPRAAGDGEDPPKREESAPHGENFLNRQSTSPPPHHSPRSTPQRRQSETDDLSRARDRLPPTASEAT